MSNKAQALLSLLKTKGIIPEGLSDNSRTLKRGELFLAYPGRTSDGRDFISDALQKGACAVLFEEAGFFAWDPAWAITHLAVSGLKNLKAPLAHAIFAYPSERMPVIAVTGTNGKTSVTQWLRNMHPRPAGQIGTLGTFFPAFDGFEETGLTTPDAITLTACLAKFAAAGAHACCLEASSIGMEEGRMDGMRIDTAVFTNLTRDHLDYHGSMEAYAASKARLFAWDHLRTAVINLDDPFALELLKITTASRIIGYTQEGTTHGVQAVIRAENIEERADGLQFLLKTTHDKVLVKTPLIGRFNIANLLAVAAVLTDLGVPAHKIAEGFCDLAPPAGRLQKVAGEGNPLVIVDYAHTPDALENVLKAVRTVTAARGGALHVVFGCGGSRDAGKRPVMGEIAARFSDRVTITSDNPRAEAPEAIVEDIALGCPEAKKEVDRKEAIHLAIFEADDPDVILIAGKGHEDYQEIAGVRYPFSDVEAAKNALFLRWEKKR